jgi:hypothetical protein
MANDIPLILANDIPLIMASNIPLIMVSDIQSLVGRAAILVVLYVNTLKSDVIVFFSNVIMYITLH